jgi:uncharacterized protein (TIGR03437 family)
MIRLSTFILLASAVILRLSAAPVITKVANAASQLAFASPIAQGSIIVIYGTGLGPAEMSIAPSAFQSTTLSGTSVSVTVGATTVNALMYYTSAMQVAALLPSNTPTGAGMFTVTYNGQTSNAMGHGVTASNLGIFTVDSTGEGPGIVTYPDFSLVSAAKASPCGGPYTACGAANPGDTLILWGTGLGPVSGNEAAGAGAGHVPGPIRLLHRGRPDCLQGAGQRPHRMCRSVGGSDWRSHQQQHRDAGGQGQPGLHSEQSRAGVGQCRTGGHGWARHVRRDPVREGRQQ